MKRYPNIEEVPSLFLAIKMKNIAKVKSTLKKHSNLANEYNSYDGSALHCAIYKNSLPIVQLLLEYGANIYQENYSCENCIEYAQTHSSINTEAQNIYDLILSIDEKKQFEKNLQSNLIENKEVKKMKL